jgi:sortase A
MLIFGHTSDYRWNNNEFGQIFRNIPKLTQGQIIKVIWNNQMYQYRVIAKEVVKPKNVSKTYAKYHDDDKQYLTLVGCYPIGTADSRIVIVAELLPDDGSTAAQPSNEVVQLARNP